MTKAKLTLLLSGLLMGAPLLGGLVARAGSGEAGQGPGLDNFKDPYPARSPGEMVPDAGVPDAGDPNSGSGSRSHGTRTGMNWH
jgi:hypothetical protein